MKTLYIDCAMGAAGDMLAAALVDATRDPEATVARLNAIGLHGVEYALERTSRCGLAACRLVVKVHGEEEGAAHGHGHAHHEQHHAHHAHRINHVRTAT